MNISLKAKSSSGGYYDVSFEVEDGLLKSHCTCKASAIKKHSVCKHRLGLMGGNEKFLFDPAQKNELMKLLSFIGDLEGSSLLIQLADAESELEKAQDKVKTLRAMIDTANGKQRSKANDREGVVFEIRTTTRQHSEEADKLEVELEFGTGKRKKRIHGP